MAGIDKIEDPNANLPRMLSMQAACILLKCAFPRDRHGQYERIEWRMVEALADKLARGEECTG